MTQRNVDYEELNHTIRLDHLRAGNHDESGMNDYYFVVKFFGLVSNEEERRKPEKERRMHPFEGGTFGEVTLKSLSFWQKSGNVTEYRISGDFIREIISATMNQFKVVETETAVLAKIEMYEKNKKYVFFGEDVLIATASYYPIPASKFDAPPRTNLDLNLKDDKGTNVVLKVEYPKQKETAAN